MEKKGNSTAYNPFFYQIPTFIRTSSIFVAVTLIILNEYLSIWTVSFNFGKFLIEVQDKTGDGDIIIRLRKIQPEHFVQGINLHPTRQQILIVRYIF